MLFGEIKLKSNSFSVFANNDNFTNFQYVFFFCCLLYTVTYYTFSKSYPCLRSFDVSEISKTGKLETVLEVKIDLSKLEKLYGLFTVKEIQDEVFFQMGITRTMIILYCNGTPVKDSPNTRGELLVK